MGHVVCPQCGKVLASVACGKWAIVHAGREYLAEKLLAVRCDRCHLPWQVLESPNGDVVLLPRRCEGVGG